MKINRETWNKLMFVLSFVATIPPAMLAVWLSPMPVGHKLALTPIAFMISGLLFVGALHLFYID